MSVAGLLVHNSGALGFIPAAIIRTIRHDIVVTRLPNSELGMALVLGRVVPVISLGDEGRTLIICEVDGELFAISGLEPIESGIFDGDERGMRHEGAWVRTLAIEEQVKLWRAHA